MTESEVKKCPKCRGIMMVGILPTKKKVSLETDLRRHLIQLYVDKKG